MSIKDIVAKQNEREAKALEEYRSILYICGKQITVAYNKYLDEIYKAENEAMEAIKERMK